MVTDQPGDAALSDASNIDGDALPDTPPEAHVPDAGGCDGSAAALAMDPMNCGRCGHDCLGGDCASGVCQPITLAMEVEDAMALALDDGHVYWTTDGAGYVRRVAKDGGTVATLASGQDFAWTIAVDTTTAYWVTNENDGGGGIHSAAEVGGALTALSTIGGVGVAVDTASVYWADGAMSGHIWSVAHDGGGATALASNLPMPWRIALDATSVYWTEPDAGRVRKVPLGGGDPTTLASGLQEPTAIAVDGADAYWTDAQSGSVSRVPIGGGAPETLATLTTEVLSVEAVAVDSTAVYFTNYARARFGGGLWMAPKSGGAASRLVSCDQGLGTALDSRAVYWACNGAIMKVGKP